MSRQYYAVTLESEQETHMSPKASSARGALDLTRKQLGYRANQFKAAVATPLSTRKQEALDLVESVKARNKKRWQTYNEAMWDPKKSVVQLCAGLITEAEHARERLLKSLGEGKRSLAESLRWGEPAEAIVTEEKAEAARSVLLLIEKGTNPVDAIVHVCRHVAARLIEERLETTSAWQRAVKAEKRRAHQAIASGLGGFLTIAYRARSCEEARAKLGFDPAPWAPVDLKTINPEFR